MSGKLIVLNGSCGIGKTTLAQRYIDEHPLALHVKIDEIIVMLGQWEKDEETARRLAIDLAKGMIETHLHTGHDVIVPYILTSVTVAEEFAEIAKKRNVSFYEVVLMTEKNEAVERMMERGTWGEAGTAPLTENDRHIIEGLYDAMQEALEKRPNAKRILSEKNHIDNSYNQLLSLLT